MANVSTKSALFWASIDKVITNGFALVISIVLARIVAPSDFGIIATAMIFTVIFSLFVEPGMTSALIQKKEPDALDYSTILVFNLVIGLVLYGLLFFFAANIANWFELPELKWVLRAMGVQIIIGSINSVQIAYVQKQMLFKPFFYCSFSAAVVSALVAVSMAYSGFGVWALVANNVIRSFFLLITVSLSFKLHFHFCFYKDRFKEMFPFASKMLLAKFIDQGYVEVTQTIISKMYSPTDLAFYNRGKSFPDLMINNLNSALGNVLFPAFSKLQDDEKQLKASIKNAMGMTSFVCFPLLTGMMGCAQNMITVLLTDKWINSVVYLQIICLYFLWVPFSSVVWQSLKAIGASNRVLQLEFIKTMLNVATLILFVFLLKSPLAVAVSLACSYFISFVIENIYVVKYIEIPFKEIVVCYLPSLLMAIAMGIIVYAVRSITNSPLISLCIQIILGAALYFFFSYIFKNPQFQTIKSKVQEKRSKL